MARIGASGTGGQIFIPPTILDATIVNAYAEITGVAAGIETTIVTYTSPASGSISYLEFVSVSGNNIAEFKVYEVAIVLDKKRTYFTMYNTDFDFKSAIGLPGYEIPPSTTISVKVLHNRPSLGAFDARIQVIEVVI